MYIPKIAESKDNDVTYNKFDNKSHKSSEYKSLNDRELKEVDSKEYAFGNGDSDVYLSMFNTSYEDEQQEVKQEDDDSNSLYDNQSKTVESLRSDTKEEMNLNQRKVWNQAVLDRNKEILESKGIYSGSYEQSKETSNQEFVTGPVRDENQSYYQSGKEYKSTDDYKSEGHVEAADNAEGYGDEDEDEDDDYDEDEDDEDDDDGEEEEDDDDENRLGNMTMSAGLMKLLGMDTSEEPSESEIDWVPPDKAGLDNSEVLIKKPLSMIESVQSLRINYLDKEDKPIAPAAVPSSSLNSFSPGPSINNLGMSMQSEQKDYFTSNFDNNFSVQTNYLSSAPAAVPSSSLNSFSPGPSINTLGMSLQSEQKDYNIPSINSYTMPYPSDAKLFYNNNDNYNNIINISESFGNVN